MFDWYCETHRCKMSVKSCITRRTLSQSKQRWPKGSIYPECRVCESYAAKEDEVGRKPKVEETKPEPTAVDELTCLICNKRKPRDHFKPNDSLRGCSSACLECTQEALKHPHPDIKIDGVPIMAEENRIREAGKKMAETMLSGLQPNTPDQDRVIRSERFSECVKSASTTKKNESFGILDFSDHMDIHNAVADLARKEFRTFDLQVLYILNRYLENNASHWEVAK